MSAGIPWVDLAAATSLPSLDPPLLHTAAEWAWRASWQATLLAVLVLVVRKAMGSRLSARARSALWWIVFARLLLPPVPLHRPTLWRHSPSGPVATADPVIRQPAIGSIPTPVAVPLTPADPIETSVFQESCPSKRPVPAALPSHRPIASAPTPWFQRLPELLAWLPLIWTAGAILFLARLAAGAMGVARRLHGMSLLNDRTVDVVLERCAAQIGLRRPPRVLAAPGLGGPAVAGIVRPALLVPPDLPARITEDELRLVLLHELAHIKRRDLPLSWLLGILAALHWFNPLLIWAIRRVRADRELACDEAAIRADGPDSGLSRGKAYGAALLRLAELLSNRFPLDDSSPQAIPAAIPAAPGMLPAFRTARELDRRIAMAVRFFPSRPVWPTLLCGGLLVAAGVLLVDAAEPAAPSPSPALQAGIPVSRPAPGQVRSVPVLGQIPLLGRLFQTAAPGERASTQAESAPEVGGNRPAPGTGGVPTAPPSSPDAAPAPGPAPAPAPAVDQAAAPDGPLEVIRAKLKAKHAELAAANEALAAAEHASDAKAISKVDLLQAKANVAKLQAELVELEWEYKSATAAARSQPQPAPSPTPAMGVIGGPAAGVPGGAPAPQAQPGSGAINGTPHIETDAERAADAQSAAKLDKVLPELKFDGVSLTDVVAFMRDTTGLSFFVDWSALRDAGIDPNAPVTIEAKNLPVAVALDRILRSSGDGHLGCVIDHGQVFISTTDRLSQMLVTRTYDVSGMAADKDLPKLIEKFVAPDSWVDNGGSIGQIERFGDRLIVTQSKLNYPQLDRFMALLHEDQAHKTTATTAPPAANPPPTANTPAAPQ